MLHHIGTWRWGSVWRSVLWPFHGSRCLFLIIITELVRGRPASLSRVFCLFGTLSPGCQAYTHITHLQAVTLEPITLKCSLWVAGCPSLVEHKEWVLQCRLELNLHQHSKSAHVNTKTREEEEEMKKRTWIMGKNMNRKVAAEQEEAN